MTYIDNVSQTIYDYATQMSKTMDICISMSILNRRMNDAIYLLFTDQAPSEL